MRKLVPHIGTLIVALAGAVTLPVTACVRCSHDDAPALFERSEMVFRGTVDSTQAADGPVSVQLAQSWKGSVPFTSLVRVDGPLEKGAEYLVFASGDPLTASRRCGSLIPIERAGQTLAWLNRELLDGLAAAEARWAASKPAIYEFGVELRCFCGSRETPVRFRVGDGLATPVQELRGREEQMYGRYDTVEKIFAAIRRAITEGAGHVDTRYDQAAGYPTVVDLNPALNTADDELTIRIVDLRRIE